MSEHPDHDFRKPIAALGPEISAALNNALRAGVTPAEATVVLAGTLRGFMRVHKVEPRAVLLEELIRFASET